jgi:hypothetical protein
MYTESVSISKSEFSWLDCDLAKILTQILTEPMPRGRGELFYRNRPSYLNQKFVNGKRHVIFTGYYPYVGLIKKSAALRKSGKYYTTLLASCVREDSEPLSFFDQVYEATDYRELLCLLKECDVQAINVHVPHLWFGALAVEAARENGTRVVIDINDAAIFLKDDPEHVDCRLEQKILTQADAFIHKMPTAAIQEMRRIWRLKTPGVKIDSLPTDGFTAGRYNGYQHSKNLKTVFAGGVMPYELAMKRGHEGHVFDPLIQDPAFAVHDLTVYVNQNARDMHWVEHSRYFDMAEKNSHFNFLAGVPCHRLPFVLCQYDLAIYYENNRISSYNPKHFQYNMATKIFSYIEAGLPILVVDGADYIGELITDHGIGTIFCPGRLMEALADITPERMTQLRVNIEAFRDAYEMSSQLKNLEDAYGCAQ